MTDISAASFFRQAAADDGGINFEHEETETGSSIWPTRIKLKALHPETGEEMGFLDYQVPRRKSSKITVHELKTHEGHLRKGVGSALMDEMQRRHPGTPIDHGDRTPDGKAWWKGYTDGKRVQRGRTIASLTDAFRTASASLPDGLICIYPHYTGLTATAGEYHDPEKEHDRSTETWTQRRQYAAESRAQYLLPEHKIASPEDAQALADKVTQASHLRPIAVSHDPSYNYSFQQEHPDHGGRSRIVLGNGGMNQLTLLHELAHHVDRERGTYNREEGHGESFHEHFNRLLRLHHPQGQMAEWAMRDRFHATDEAMRRGEGAYLFADIPDPKMTDRERALRPPEKPKPLWGHEKHDPETLDLATEAHVVGNHYLKHMSEYPRLDPSKGPVAEQVAARGADKNLSQGTSVNLIKPSHLKNWVDHHPDLEGIKRRFLQDSGYDDYDQMRRELYNKFPDNAPKNHAPWTGADPHKVMTHEHEAGNHYAQYPGHDIDDLDYDAPEEHWRPHWEAIGTDGLLKDGYVKPHQISHEDAAQWLQYHPDRAGIEQRHGVSKTAAVKPCPCCGGTGEHGTGFECYHCDAGMTVPADSPDDVVCDGTLPDGGHGKTASAERPEWADGDFTAKTGHTYHTVTEPKCVTMRTPEGRLAGWVNWGDDGVIGNMNVREQHQRRGIATELLRRAREIRPDLQHSNRLSNDAQAWLKGIGERTASADTPVPDNDQPYEHEHDWLPRDHFFAPGEKGLDPRLFDENERMHPIVRQHLLSLLNGFWAPKYGDSWQSWARVFLAGSEASHWYGNGDLDVLIGVDYDRAREMAPTLVGMSDREISTHLTDELRSGLNDDQRMLPGPDGKETGPWENTWFVNP